MVFSERTIERLNRIKHRSNKCVKTTLTYNNFVYYLIKYDKFFTNILFSNRNLLIYLFVGVIFIFGM